MSRNRNAVNSRFSSIPMDVREVFFYTLSMAGGGDEEQSLVMLSSELADAGMLVHWITFDAANAACPYGVPSGVEWIRLAESCLTRLEPRSAPSQADRLVDLLECINPPQLLCWGDASFPSAFLASSISRTSLTLFRTADNAEFSSWHGLLNPLLGRLAFLISSRICLPEAGSLRHLPFFLRKKAAVAPHAFPAVASHPDLRYRFSGLAKTLVSLLFLATSPSRYRRFKENKQTTATAIAQVFDAAWYARNHAPALPPEQCLQHYLSLGQYLGYNPHPLFWSQWYLDQHPIVAASLQNPWLHYHVSGFRLGCNPNPFFHSRWYQAAAGIGEDANPLLHYLAAASAVDPNPLFDAAWYRATYPEACGRFTTLLEDYLATGADFPCHPLFMKHPSLSHDASGNCLNYKTIFEANLDYRHLDSSTKHSQGPAGKRFAVCTVITGGYDHPLAVQYRDPHTTYFLLTDRSMETPPGWDEVIVLPSVDGDPLKQSRYLKMHLLDAIPNSANYEAIAYVDGNIELSGTLEDFFQAFLNSGCNLGLAPHPMRYCAYQEAAVILLWNRDRPDNVRDAIAFLERENFPDNAGLFEMNFFIARPTPEARAFFVDWWNLFERYGNRDQLLAPYVLWKRGLEPFPLFQPPLSVRDHPSFTYQSHA